MKKGIGLALGSILIFSFLVACGIPQDKYDKVNSDLTAAKTQIQTLQSDLTVKNSQLVAKDTELKTAQNALSTKETELKAVQSELSAKETEFKTTQEKMGQAKSMIEVINGIFIPAMNGELYEMTETESFNYFLSWRDKVNAIGDPLITAKFQAIIDSEGSDEAMLAFFVYLFESVPKVLE